MRWHGDPPSFDESTYRLEVDGLVGEPVRLTLDAVRSMPAREVVALLECAGNNRALSGWPDAANGTPWGFGGVSCSRWTGVSVITLLDTMEVDPEAVEVVFTGGGEVPITRALPVRTILDPDTIVAWAHDRETLLPEHGWPLRLVVPGWYGISWTKALVRIQVTRESWRGVWDDAFYSLREAGRRVPNRVTVQSIKSVIAHPRVASCLPRGRVQVRGFAWSGRARIAEVSLSIDDGPFEAVRLGKAEGRGWTPWSAEWDATPGMHTLRARATDTDGATQPAADEVPPNVNAYCFNGVIPVTIRVT